jgi:hypothetical protein
MLGVHNTALKPTKIKTARSERDQIELIYETDHAYETRLPLIPQIPIVGLAETSENIA